MTARRTAFPIVSPVSELLAVLSSLMWGTADFLGGTFTRRLRPLTVVSLTVPAAVPVLLVVVLVSGEWRAPTGYLPWALASGPVGLLSVTAFYRALATGTMGVVAPLAATGVVVPLAVGLVQGGAPSPVALAGLVLATLATIAASASGPNDDSSPPPSRRPLLLAFVSGLGFGFVTVGIGEGAHSSVLMTLLVMRSTSSVVLLGVWLTLRQRPRVSVRDGGLLWLVGLMDAGANAVYGSAVRIGLFSVIVVLGSLYPAATVLLARQVHGERLQRVQVVGVVALLVAVPMIAVG
ncbi:EamA family transporter [Acidothermaceae bacterium B102]|nr:EamA family transporter [Acidothermaceae bacterium B102]